MGKPSLGSGVSYGLGTENQNLPSFVVLPDPSGGIKDGPPAYGAGFLPASHQGTVMRGGNSPILDLSPPNGISADQRRGVSTWEEVVERLLASPQYGERGAQHWLDLARYADSDGFEFDQARPNAWRDRDWVVAGDKVAPDDASTFIVTGFNRCYPDLVEPERPGLAGGVAVARFAH